MIRMGIDASSTCTGWCIFDNERLVDCGKIHPVDKKADWRDRLRTIIPQLNYIVETYKPSIAYIEDVPLIGTGSKQTLVILGAIQGSIISLFSSKKIQTKFIGVSDWRSKLGLFTGKRNGMTREAMKQSSIEYANKTFNLNLQWVSANSSKNDDDISDSIGVVWSQISKNKKGFKRG